MTSKKDKWQPPYGQYLGGMTDELQKDFGVGAYAFGFVATGPKSYSMLVRCPDKENPAQPWKVKGYKKTCQLETIMEFAKLKEMVTFFVNNQDDLMTKRVEFTGIRRTVYHSVKTVAQTKDFHVTYDKGCVMPDATTRPYGYY